MSEPLGRVLVVDDSEDDQLHLRRLLRERFHVTAVYSAEEAIERLDRESFDALVTDQRMPRVSGDELINRVKADPRFQDLPCILLSGKASDVELVEILRGGRVFNYFDKDKTLLTKDGQTELLLALRAAVQACQLERERARLNRRLRSQVEALTGQYKLFKTLVGLKDPAAVLRLVVQSLAQRLPCRGAVGLVDLLPNRGAFAHLAVRGDGQRFTDGEAAACEAWVRDAYARLAARDPGAELVFSHTPEVLPRGETIDWPMDLPHLPVFVDRDLRGIIGVVRDDERPLESDERELVGVWRDQLQDALTRSYIQVLDEQRRMELMVETMSEGVIMTDDAGTVMLMNPGARRMLKLVDTERIDFSVIVSAMDLSSLDVLRQLGPGDTKVAWREIAFGEAIYQVLFSPVRDHAGAFVGVLTLLRDITEQKQTEQRREEFVHIIGHELRSPLTSIGGVLDLMSKQVLGELSDRQREYVEMARESCVKINQILNDLLDLAKFEKGKMPLTIESIHLDAVVLDTVRQFRPVSIERQINLSFECLVEDLVCEADAYRIGQVMNNLLSNALKFTPRDGEVVVSVLTSFTVPDLYLCTVCNTGEEIPEPDLERIFNKFEQVDVGERRSIGGTGLGLPICRSIIEGHGGRIWVESGQGQGTTFAFSLPCAPTAGETIDTGTARGGPGGMLTDGQPLLLVYDDEHEALAFKARLLQLGFEVALAPADGPAVAERIGTIQPALALYLETEGESHDDVLAELAAHNDLPVLALMPPGGRPNAPVDMVLEIPADPAALSGTLNIVLLRQRHRRRLRVLVVDVDDVWRARTAQYLDDAGYLAYQAANAAEAARRIDTLLPDLVVLDVSLPGAQGLVQRLRGDAGGEIPLLVTGVDGAVPADVRLEPGLIVPRDTPGRELLVQVRSRVAEDRRRGVDALVILPGSRELAREVQTRIRDRQPYAYCAIDIEGLRDGIDRRGFMWGHGVMAQTAELVHRVLRDRAPNSAFLGHQRDDDFVFLIHPDAVETVCREIVGAFDRLEPLISGGDDPEASPLRLAITAVVDTDGRFSAFSALQSELTKLRVRDTGELLFIDRGDPTAPGR